MNGWKATLLADAILYISSRRAEYGKTTGLLDIIKLLDNFLTAM